MNWMQDSLPPQSVIAAWWDYGSQLNLLAHQATIVDEDHFIPYWIHLMARHVFCESNPEVALSFLKAHQASYLAISLDDLWLLGTISTIGSNETFDRKTGSPIYLTTTDKPFRLREGGYVLRFPAVQPAQGDFPLALSKDSVIPANQWMILDATLEFKASDGGYVPLAASVKGITKNGKTLALFPRRVLLDGREAIQKDAKLPGTVVCFSPSGETKNSVWKAFYISEKMEQFLSVRLLLLGENIPSFRRVYPTDQGNHLLEIGIWRIEYPPHITPRPESLLTDFLNPTLRRSWMQGYLP